MSFEFDATAADATPDATEQGVLEELRATDAAFVQLWQAVLEPSLRIRLNTANWPEHRRAHLARCAQRAYAGQRSEIEREGRGGFSLDERELLALAQLRDAALLPDRRTLLSKFGLIGGSQKLPAAGVVPGAEWKRLPVAGPRDRSDVFWRFCADRRFPHYEVLTREFVTALGSAIASHVALFAAASLVPSTTTPATATVVEVGAGSGRLCHFLTKELATRDAQSTGGVRVRVVATDDMSERVPVQFPVERCSVQDAIAAMSPLIVIAQWMPLGEDWTAVFRQCPTVQEYLLIGPPEVTGNVEKTWTVDFEGWEKIELLEVGKWQICRCDSRDSIGHSTTILFRRTHGLKSGQLDAIIAAKTSGNDFFRNSSFASARQKYLEALDILATTTDTAFTKIRVQLMLNTCLCLFNEGNAAKAKELSSRAIAEDAASAKAHHVLGKACRLMGDFAMARTELTRALELEPGNSGTERELHQLEADEKAKEAEQTS